MPRKPKQDEGQIHHAETEGEAPPPSNGIDEGLMNEFIDAVHENRASIKAIMVKARQDCQPFRDAIDEVITEAAENGMPKKAFRAQLTRLRKLQEADAVREALNDSAKAAFDEMTAKLRKVANDIGPLGEAALRQHEAAA